MNCHCFSVHSLQDIFIYDKVVSICELVYVYVLFKNSVLK